MRQGADTTTRERGAILMFVLLVTLLIAAITLGVMQLISADSIAGVRELQAVRTFNVAEAGMHWALAHLQSPASGAANYAGGTQTITSGSTTLGTATITVNCIDTTTSNGYVPPCTSGSAYPAFRRVISVGTLTVGGPSRTIVAVVQGSSSGGGGGPTYAVCNSSTINTDPGLTVYGNWGTNSNFDFAVPYGDSTDVLKPCSAYTGGTCPGGGTSTGKIVSAGTVTCDGSCSAQFPGGVTNNASPVPCGSVTLGTFTPGATSLSPGSNYTMNSTTGYNWNNVTIGAGTLSGGTCTAYRDLTIVAPAAAGTTQVVQMNKLTMNQCSRLIISGAGNIDLRIASTASGEGGTLYVYPYTHFGVLPTDTASTPAPVPAGQLTVEMQSVAPTGANANTRSYSNAIFCADIGSSGATANACVASGYFMIPNGLLFMDYWTTLYGAVVSTQFTSEQHDILVFDASSGGGSGSSTYTNFTSLMSWKDE